MAFLETDNRSYYLHKLAPLFMGTLTIGGPLIPDSEMIVNGAHVEPTFYNALPFIIVGFMFLVLFVWLCFNYYRVLLTDDKVEIQLMWKEKKYKWEDFESIHDVTWLWGGVIFKFKPKDKRAFYVCADRPEMINSNLMGFTQFRSKMSEFISWKKQELGI